MTGDDIGYTCEMFLVLQTVLPPRFFFFFLSIHERLRIVAVFVELMFPLACFHPKMSVAVHAEILLREAGPGRARGSSDRMNIGVWLHLDPVFPPLRLSTDT